LSLIKAYYLLKLVGEGQRTAWHVRVLKFRDPALT
jgi:hypothetical protein